MNRPFLFILTCIILAGISYWGHSIYQDNQQKRVWESLLALPSCDSCAARKEKIRNLRNVE